MVSWTSLLPLACIILWTTAAPVKRQSLSPAIPADFPDPQLLQAGNDWFAYATSNNQYHVQLANSPNLIDGWVVLQQDALPTLASWAQSPVWAPGVIQRVSCGLPILYMHPGLTSLRMTVNT
jgi:hypothetical protein